MKTGYIDNSARYILLTASIFVAHWVTGITGLEAKVVEPGGPFNWAILFLTYLMFLVISDQAWEVAGKI
jgi:hypothetical protein